MAVTAILWFYHLSGETLTFGLFASLYTDTALLCFIYLCLPLPLCVLQQSEIFQMQMTCCVQIRSLPLLLLTLLLCISMRSDCIVMLHRLQNTHFHLWLSLCGQSRDRLTTAWPLSISLQAHVVYTSRTYWWSCLSFSSSRWFIVDFCKFTDFNVLHCITF